MQFLSPASFGTRRTDVVLFSILFVDIIILLFAVTLLCDEIGKRVRRSVSVAPAAVPAPTARCTVPLPPARPRPAPARTVPAASADISAPALDFLEVSAGDRAGEEGRYGGVCSAGALDAGGLVLTYDVSSPSAWARHVRLLDGIDVRNYTAFEFQVKGTTGDEVFKIELSDGASRESVFAYELFPSRVPVEWQKVSLPLSRFRALGDPGKGGHIALVFEYNQGMPYSGTVCLKDLRLVR